MRTFKKVVSLLLMLTLTVFAGSCATHHYEGAAAGAAVGGLGGALMDKENPWRGGVIGAALGAVFGSWNNPRANAYRRVNTTRRQSAGKCRNGSGWTTNS